MEVYPSRTQLPELLPQPVLAGVIGGICFLSVAVIFSTMAACIMNRRRAARLQKRRQGRSRLAVPGERAKRRGVLLHQQGSRSRVPGEGTGQPGAWGGSSGPLAELSSHRRLLILTFKLLAV